MSDSSTPLVRPIEPPRFHKVLMVARSRSRRYWLHALLLLLTLLTTLVVGAHLQYNFDHNLPAFTTEEYQLPALLTHKILHISGPVVLELPFPLKWILQQPQRLALGIPFAATLLGILLAHEMGHFVYCERNGVFATLPYFLPGPLISPIGTFGAVIRIKSQIRTRQALFDIGIAGPIAGFVVAVPVLLCGSGAVETYFAAGFGVVDRLRLSVDFSYFARRCTACAAANAFAERDVSPSGWSSGVGGNAGDSVKPAARRAARWRPPGVCGGSEGAQVGHYDDGRGAGTAFAVLDWLAGVGADPGPDWAAASAGGSVAGSEQRAIALRWWPLPLFVLTWTPAPILGQGWLVGK